MSSLYNIKKDLLKNKPILAPSKSFADIFNILMDTKSITYDNNLQEGKIYDCQSLYFKDPLPCKYTLNLSTFKTSENSSGELTSISSELKNKNVQYYLSQNNIFPNTVPLYKIIFYSDRLNKEAETIYIEQLYDIIRKSISNIVLLDCTPFVGCNVLNFARLNERTILIATQPNETYYNALIENWKSFGFQNNHQFFKSSINEVLKNGKLIFFPNVIYSENDISILESKQLNANIYIIKTEASQYDQVISKISKEKFNINTMRINNNFVYLILENTSNESLSGSVDPILNKTSNNLTMLFDEVVLQYNNLHSVDPNEYIQGVAQKICKYDDPELKISIPSIVDSLFYKNIITRSENIENINLNQKELSDLLDVEMIRSIKYKKLKETLKTLLKQHKKLEAPKLLLRFVFALIIKRMPENDPVFVTSDFSLGIEVIEKDAKYFKLPDKLTPQIVDLLINGFQEASNFIKNYKITNSHENINIFDIIKFRYDYLELSTLGLAYPYENKGYKSNNSILECFSNPYNKFFDKFCTAFPDLEKYVGSIGSFWEIKNFPYKKLMINPPFDETVIQFMFQKIYEILNSVGNIEIEIILPNWSDMEELKQFTKGTIQLPNCNYTTQVIPKKEIYFIDYSQNSKIIRPCDILMINITKTLFTYEDFVKACNRVKGEKSLIKESLSDEYTIILFSPFKEIESKTSTEFPEVHKDTHRITIDIKSQYISSVLPVLEKFLSNYGDAISYLIFNNKQIFIDVFSPHFENFVHKLLLSGIVKYTVLEKSHENGNGIQVLLLDETTNTYKETPTSIQLFDDKNLSQYKIKIARSELEYVKPSTEMLLMEPIFIFGFNQFF
jgi:REP element-mobilizing transposase RayT